MIQKKLAIISFSVAGILLLSFILLYFSGFGTNINNIKATPVPGSISMTMPPAPTDPLFPEPTVIPDLPIVTAEEFLNPSLKFRPYLIMNDSSQALDKGKAVTLEQKMEYLLGVGFGGLVTNVAWNKDYLQDDKAFVALIKILDAARARSLGTWLYDEYDFPSGTANQLTMDGHPEYAAIGLGQIIKRGTGKSNVTIDIPKNMQQVVSATIFPIVKGAVDNTQGKNVPLNISNGKLTVEGLDSGFEIQVFGVYPVNVDDNIPADASGQKRVYPNLLNKDAVARFIDITYQQYKNKIPDFSNRIQAFFTDEPTLTTERYYSTDGYKKMNYPLVPWEGTLADRFKAKFGYDLLQNLTSLYAGDSDVDKQVRQNYYEIVGDMFSENYTGQIEKWCQANGTNLSGHYFFEEMLAYEVTNYGDLFQTYCASGFPGVDALSMFPDNYLSGGLFEATKLASSAARYRNVSSVMVELCPVDNVDKFNTNHHEYATGYVSELYAAGITHVNCYYDPCTTSDEQGKLFNDYVGRMGTMLDNAVMNSGIGVFYSTKTAQQYQIPSKTQDLFDASPGIITEGSAIKDLVNRLSKAKLDFNFFNEEIIDAAAVKDGYLLSGSAKYSVIILPSVEVIPLSTMQKLDRFAQSGGKLIFTGCLPSKSNMAQENALVKSIADKYKDNLMYNSALGNIPNLALGATVTASSNAGGIYKESNITDGDADTSNWNTSWSGTAPGWVEIDLGKPQTFNSAILYTQNEYKLSDYNIEYWTGTDWKSVASATGNTKDANTYSFPSVTSQKVRIEMSKGSVDQPTTARIIEFELYDTTNIADKKSVLALAKEWSNSKLTVTEEDQINTDKLMLSQFSKYNSMFYMMVNTLPTAMTVTLEQPGVKAFKIYNPNDGSITLLNGNKLTIAGYRALFIEPIMN